MHNELFHLGPFTVYTYGLMVAIGIWVAYVLIDKRAKQKGMDTSKLDWFALSVVLGGFLGSKILYTMTRFQEVLADPAIFFDLGSGWVVYGGIIGGLVAGYLFCKANHYSFLQWLDLIVPELALAQGIGRIGCFFAGCCYGMEVDAWYGIIFPAGSLAPAGIPLFPTQLASAVFDFLLAGFLFWLAKKDPKQGTLGAWYLILYSIGRFIIEFFRGDLIRGGAGAFSTSQWISLAACAFGIAMLVFVNWKVYQKD